jgi:hypothetical protein
MFGANQEAKSVSIMRTRSAQIGVQSATINVLLDGQISSQGRARRWLRVEGKIKGLSALLSFLPVIAALAALTWRQKVIQTSDGKVKGTKVRFL